MTTVVLRVIVVVVLRVVVVVELIVESTTNGNSRNNNGGMIETLTVFELLLKRRLDSSNGDSGRCRNKSITDYDSSLSYHQEETRSILQFSYFEVQAQQQVSYRKGKCQCPV